MPLLCISLLALLLLPLSLSCDSIRPAKEVSDSYIIVQTDLDNTRENITALLHNSSCLINSASSIQRHKLRCSKPDTANVLSILHNLTCKMKNLRLPHTDVLVTSVLNSIRCPCLEKQKPTKGPNQKLKTATTQRRSGQKRNRESKKLCRAKEIMSTITECYEMLNTLLMDT